MSVFVVNCASAKDPFILREMPLAPGWQDRSDKSPRSQTVDPSKNTIVLITDGQSLLATGSPAYAPPNAAAIDNFSIYDGASYPISGPLVGPSYASERGSGSLSSYIANHLIAGGADKVILVPIAIGGTTIADHDTGALSDRFAIAMRRLASRGYYPGRPGLRFVSIFGQGESDTGTTQANWQAGFGRYYNANVAAGFSGLTFVLQETLLNGVTNPSIRAAQAAVRNGTTILDGGDLDTFTGATYRIASDNTHLTAAGNVAAAAAIYAKMQATGQF